MLKDLHDLLQMFALQKLKKGDYFESEEKLLQLARAVANSGGTNEQLKGEVKRRIRDKIEMYEEGESERVQLQSKYNSIYHK